MQQALAGLRGAVRQALGTGQVVQAVLEPQAVTLMVVAAGGATLGAHQIPQPPPDTAVAVALAARAARPQVRLTGAGAGQEVPAALVLRRRAG